MSHMKKSGFIAATIFLMFSIACGGGGNKNGGNPQTVTVSLSPIFETVNVNETRSFIVTIH